MRNFSSVFNLLLPYFLIFGYRLSHIPRQFSQMPPRKSIEDANLLQGEAAACGQQGGVETYRVWGAGLRRGQQMLQVGPPARVLTRVCCFLLGSSAHRLLRITSFSYPAFDSWCLSPP